MKIGGKFWDLILIIDRFTELGKLKNFKLKLHIDESVQPVAQPVRKIPFKMRKQVEEQIKQLEEMDVIENVEGRISDSMGYPVSRSS
jgi:hypothetical protein